MATPVTGIRIPADLLALIDARAVGGKTRTDIVIELIRSGLGVVPMGEDLEQSDRYTVLNDRLTELESNVSQVFNSRITELESAVEHLLDNRNTSVKQALNERITDNVEHRITPVEQPSENAVESPSSEQSIVKQPQPATRKVAPQNYRVLPPDIGEGMNQMALCAFYGLSWKNLKRDSTAAGFDDIEGYLQVMTGIAWTRRRERKGFIFQPIPQKSTSDDALEGASNDSVGQSLNLSDGLLQIDLCRRLKMKGHKHIAQKRQQGADALAMYTRQRDPDGKAWGYRDGRYYPVD